MAQNNRPKYGSSNPDDISFSVRIQEEGNITYVGKAKAGARDEDSVWRILKITETETTMNVQYADGNNYFDNVWAIYMSASYV
jgi:hypothetical protein